MSSFCLATAKRDFLRAAVFCLMMPFTTALSISWYASDIIFSTGFSSSSDSRLPLKPSRALNTCESKSRS